MSVGEEADRGVLNAPVDCSCSFSKISWSSFGSLGGAGEGFQPDWMGWVVEKGRRKKPGRMVRMALVAGCMMWWYVGAVGVCERV